MRKICLCHQRCQLRRHLIMRISAPISIGLQKMTSLQDQGTPFPKLDVKTIYLPKHITVHWVSSCSFFQHSIYYLLSLARHVQNNSSAAWQPEIIWLHQVGFHWLQWIRGDCLLKSTGKSVESYAAKCILFPVHPSGLLSESIGPNV